MSVETDLIIPLSRKFTKVEALYVPFAPVPPVFWEYECRACINFNPKSKTCFTVSEVGTPDPGVINPEAWCLFWLPKKNDPPFQFLIKPFLVK